MIGDSMTLAPGASASVLGFGGMGLFGGWIGLILNLAILVVRSLATSISKC